MTSSTRRLAVAGAWVVAGVLGAGALTGVALAGEGSGGPAAGPSSTDAVSTATSAAPGGGGTADRAGRLRRLAGHVLHGQLTVQGKDGVRTVDTQLGTVTAVSPTSLTAKSSDGFTLTWALTKDTRVRKDRGAASLSDLRVGDTVRLVGPASADGTGATARAVLVRPDDGPAATSGA